MGEAKRRGTYEERKANAISQNKESNQRRQSIDKQLQRKSKAVERLLDLMVLDERIREYILTEARRKRRGL